MKSLFKNPFFYLSLVLALAVGFQIYSIVAAQGTYRPPTEPPTGGMAAEPLNTGDKEQTKTGALVVGSGAPKVVLTSGGQVLFKDSGGALKGGIRFAGGAMQFSEDVSVTTPQWKAFGTGTGGGVGWALAANETDIYNSNTGNVGIGLTNPTVKLQVAGDVLVGASSVVRVYRDSGKMSSGWVENKYRLLICDSRNTGDHECFGDYSTTDATGAVKYDNFEVDLEGIKEKAKEEFVVVEITTGGKLTVGDINIISPKWSEETGEIEGRSGEVKSMDNFRPGTASCPGGYFVKGFRFGVDTNDDIFPVVICAKL